MNKRLEGRLPNCRPPTRRCYVRNVACATNAEAPLQVSYATLAPNCRISKASPPRAHLLLRFSERPIASVGFPGLREPGMSDSSLHHIVVVGGGAGGLELATGLGESLGKSGRARITLVDRGRTHVWKPLLHSIAAGSLKRSQDELDYLAQAHWSHFRYRNGEMIGLDRAAKTITLAPLEDEDGREIIARSSLAYDTLVVAVGSVTNDFGTPGAAKFAVPLDTPEQASRFNRRLVNAFLRAQNQHEPIRPAQLHVAIIGAGATGAELAGELHHTSRDIIAYGLDNIDPEKDLRIVLIEAADRILPALPTRISDATRDLLLKLGVEVRTGARVAEVLADGVRLADGHVIPSDLVVWCAGVKAPAFLA